MTLGHLVMYERSYIFDISLALSLALFVLPVTQPYGRNWALADFPKLRRCQAAELSCVPFCAAVILTAALWESSVTRVGVGHRCANVRFARRACTLPHDTDPHLCVGGGDRRV